MQSPNMKHIVDGWDGTMRQVIFFLKNTALKHISHIFKK